jgi:hypothetical protein
VYGGSWYHAPFLACFLTICEILFVDSNQFAVLSSVSRWSFRLRLRFAAIVITPAKNLFVSKAGVDQIALASHVKGVSQKSLRNFTFPERSRFPEEWVKKAPRKCGAFFYLSGLFCFS